MAAALDHPAICTIHEMHVTVLRSSTSRDAGIDAVVPSPAGRYLATQEGTTESSTWMLENF